MERKENPPLLNHLLQHFQSQWGFLEEPGRLRELEVCTCLGGRSHALITHRMPAAFGALLSDFLQLRSQLSCKMNELLISPAQSTFGPNSSLSFMGPIHLQNHLPITLQTECIISEKFLFPFPPPKLLFPNGNGLSTSLKNRSDLLGNPWYHKSGSANANELKGIKKPSCFGSWSVEGPDDG